MADNGGDDGGGNVRVNSNVKKRVMVCRADGNEDHVNGAPDSTDAPSPPTSPSTDDQQNAANNHDQEMEDGQYSCTDRAFFYC